MLSLAARNRLLMFDNCCNCGSNFIHERCVESTSLFDETFFCHRTDLQSVNG